MHARNCLNLVKRNRTTLLGLVSKRETPAILILSSSVPNMFLSYSRWIETRILLSSRTVRGSNVVSTVTREIFFTTRSRNYANPSRLGCTILSSLEQREIQKILTFRRLTLIFKVESNDEQNFYSKFQEIVIRHFKKMVDLVAEKCFTFLKTFEF